MIAMSYSIALRGSEQLREIRQRVADRGPVFDRVPGLAAKVFLLDEVDPCYELYYLWRDADSMHDFLEGPLFAALAEKFGRPEITVYLTRATSLPFRPGDLIRISRSKADVAPGLVALINPRFGDTVCLNAGRGRRLEVLYLAGSGSLKP
jgi:hypothetical protein